MFRCSLVLIVCGLVITPCRDSTAAERRDKQWLIRYLTQSIADTPRNRRYLSVIDRAE